MVKSYFEKSTDIAIIDGSVMYFMMKPFNLDTFMLRLRIRQSQTEKTNPQNTPAYIQTSLP